MLLNEMDGIVTNREFFRHIYRSCFLVLLSDQAPVVGWPNVTDRAGTYGFIIGIPETSKAGLHSIFPVSIRQVGF